MCYQFVRNKEKHGITYTRNGNTTMSGKNKELYDINSQILINDFLPSQYTPVIAWVNTRWIPVSPCIGQNRLVFAMATKS